MAKVPKSISARPKPGARSRTTRQHEQVDESPRYRVVSKHEPLFGGLFEGRAHEFSGLGLVAVGVLLVLSVYLRLAGPLGRALNSTSSSLIGVGRFFLPILCIGLGIALARRKDWVNRVRTLIGWTALTGVSLGLTHIFWGSRVRAGGWFGYIVGEPLKNLLSGIGATVVLVALFTGSIMLVSGKSAPELISAIQKIFKRLTSGLSSVSENLSKNLSGALDERSLNEINR